MSESPAPEAAEPEATAAGPEVPDETPPDVSLVTRTSLTLIKLAKPFRRTRQPATMVVLLIVALVGISLAVYFVSTGSPKGPSNAARASATTGTPASGRAAPPGPKPGGPTAQLSPIASVAGPKPLKPSDPAKVKSWNAGKGGAALVQVTEDSGDVLMAYGSGEYTETLQACTALAGAVKKAEALPPIPDTAMQKLYVKSLNTFTAGITECEAAITQHPEGVEDVVTDVNHAEINQALSRFSVGTQDLYIATEALRKQ
jgi:hypothetical protein